MKAVEINLTDDMVLLLGLALMTLTFSRKWKTSKVPAKQVDHSRNTHGGGEGVLAHFD